MMKQSLILNIQKNKMKVQKQLKADLLIIQMIQKSKLKPPKQFKAELLMFQINQTQETSRLKESINVKSIQTFQKMKKIMMINTPKEKEHVKTTFQIQMMKLNQINRIENM